MGSYFGHRALGRQAHQEKIILGTSLTVALILALSALFLLRQSHKAEESLSALPTLQPSEVEVIVPIFDIEQNTPLQPLMFKTISRPAATVSTKILRDFESIKGQFARSFLAGGEPVHASYVVPLRQAIQGSPTEALKEGYRAISIHVDDTQAVAGLVRPGEIIDVSWLRKEAGEWASSIVAENIPVLMVDTQVDPAWKPGLPIPGMITLMVTVEDYMKIDVARASGKLGLALRGSDGVGKTEPIRTIRQNELGGPKRVEQEKPKCSVKLSLRSPNGDLEELCMDSSGRRMTQD